MREFQNALHQTNTFLSKHELQKIQTLYGRKYPRPSALRDGSERSTVLSRMKSTNEMERNGIDYDMLSQSLLGSLERHNKKFDAMRKTHTRLNQIRQVFNDPSMLRHLSEARSESNLFSNPHEVSRTLMAASAAQGKSAVLQTNLK